MTLQPATIKKLDKLFPMLSSNHEGEVVATARAIIRTLATGGSSLHELGSALATKTVQKIVYREKVVYRDRPVPATAPTPPREAPEYTEITDKEEIVRLADILLKECELSANEEKFVRHMRQMAARRPKMRMSVKQKSWWNILLDDYCVKEDAA